MTRFAAISAALMLSACAAPSLVSTSGEVLTSIRPHAQPETCKLPVYERGVLVAYDLRHGDDCKRTQGRDDGRAQVAKPEKPDNYEATPENEPKLGAPGRKKWERSWERPGGGHDKEDPGWRDRENRDHPRAEGKPDRHDTRGEHDGEGEE